MIDKKVLGKTILSSYGYLQQLCYSIDRVVTETAVGSYYSNIYKDSDYSILDITNQLIKLSNRKIDYINLKIIIEKALKEMPKVYSKMLILKFVHKMTVQEAGEMLSLTKRASYRYFEQALEYFMARLNGYGYTLEKLELDYLCDPFINSMYKLMERNKNDYNEKADLLTNDTVFKKYIREIMTATT